MRIQLVLTSVNANGVQTERGTGLPAAKRAKLAALLHLCRAVNTDVLCLQETHHLPGESLDVDSLPGYRVVCAGDARTPRRVGGVAILARAGLCLQPLSMPACGNVSCCAARVFLSSAPPASFVLVCVYVPPASRSAPTHLAQLADSLPAASTAVWAGDFNPVGYDFDEFLEASGGIELNDRNLPTFSNCRYATTPDRMLVMVDPSWIPDAILRDVDDADAARPSEYAHVAAYPARRVAIRISDHLPLSWAIPVPARDTPDHWREHLDPDSAE